MDEDDEDDEDDDDDDGGDDDDDDCGFRAPVCHGFFEEIMPQYNKFK